jgi:hypothetical protein
MPDFQPANEHLGYYFHPPVDAHAIGYPQLDVVIRPAPTGDHIDPESVACHIATNDRSIRLHVVHPWTQETTYRVCLGEIDIEGMRQEHVKAFTFGGTLRIDSDSRRTLCQIISPAPLLEHARQTMTLPEQVIEEVQILIAERRAAPNDDDAFELKLAAVDPLLLYHACLVALHEKFAHFPATDDAQHHFKQFLLDATRSLKDETIPALSDLL